jgi:hypothetical protein
MDRKIAFALATILALPGLTQAEEKTKTKAQPAAESSAVADTPKAGKPEHNDTTPVWIIEEFWFPLRFEPMETFDAARYHYRRHEEKSAAREIHKAVSWLNLAAEHAMPETKKHLQEAASELKTVAADLESGNLVAGKKLDASLAKSAHALATWHFFKAKEAWGKTEEADAGKHLVMAANYLQHAATSAHYQFGPDTEEVMTKVFRNGKETQSESHTKHNWVATDLEGIEAALRELGKTMEK